MERRRSADRCNGHYSTRSPPAMSPGRNDPCPCGSGKKYRRCHGAIGTPAASPMQGRKGSVASPGEVRAPAPLPKFAVYAPAASPAALLDAAARRLDAGDVAGAESLYRECLEQQPDHVDAATALGCPALRPRPCSTRPRRFSAGWPHSRRAARFGPLQSRRRAVQARSRRGGGGGPAARRVDAARLRDRARQPRCGAGGARAPRRGRAGDSRGAGDRRAQSFRTLQPRHAADARDDEAALACFDRALAIDADLLRRARAPREAAARPGTHRRRGDVVAARDHAGAGDDAGLEQPADDAAVCRRRVGRELLVWHRRFDTALAFARGGAAPRSSSPQRAAHARRSPGCASAFFRPTCASTRWAISSSSCSSTTTARRSSSSAITTA